MSGFVASCRELRPEIAVAGSNLAKADLVAMADSGMPWAEAAPRLLAAL